MPLTEAEELELLELENENAKISPSRTVKPTRAKIGHDSALQMGDVLYPSLTSSIKKGQGQGRQTLALLGDVASGVLRVPSAALRTGMSKVGLSGDQPLTFKQSLDLINRQLTAKGEKPGFVSGIGAQMVTDPTTVPTMAAGGPVFKGATSLLQGVRGGKVLAPIVSGAGEGAISGTGHQLEKIAQGEDADIVDLAGETALGTLGGMLSFIPVGLRKLKSGTADYLKDYISRFSEINQAALERASKTGELDELITAAKQGGTQNEMADEILENVNRMNEDKRKEFASKLMKFKNDAATLAERGTQIQGTIKEAKDPLQQRYVEGERAGVGPLRESPAQTVKKQVEGPLVEIEVQPGVFEQVPSKKTKVVAEVQDQINQVREQFKASGEGIPKVSMGAVKTLNRFTEMTDNVKTIDDLIDLKAQVRGAQSMQKFEGSVFDPTRDDLAFGEVIRRIDDSIENSIRDAAGDASEGIISLMKANNERYSIDKGLLSQLDQGIGRVQNVENVATKIKNMGPERLAEIKNIAQNNKTIAPVWEQLQKGFVDDIVSMASDQSGVNVNKFAKSWFDVSDDVKNVMLEQADINRINTAVAKASTPDVGTKIFGPGMRYETGVQKIENIGAQNVANREALKQLEFIDNVIGLKGNDRFSKRAMDAFQSKQLRITEKGTVPGMTEIKTGKALGGFMRGAGVGSLAGYASGNLPGMIIGNIVGGSAGAYTQSPAGAITAFRIINGLKDISEKTPVRQTMRAIGKTMDLGTSRGPRQALRSGFFGRSE